MTRPKGFIYMAGTNLTLKFGMRVLLLLAVAASITYRLWTSVLAWLNDGLNNCVDKRAELGELGEQPYKPSKEYLSCTHSVDVSARMLVAIATVLLLCALVAVLAHVVNDYVRRAYRQAGLPLPIKLKTVLEGVYRDCGLVAFVAAWCVVMVLTPMG
jgi:hypothetical protein